VNSASGTCSSEKNFSIENIIFLFQVFDLRFFTQILILQQCLDPNPNFFSDSGPAKTFRFGSTTLVDPDPDWAKMLDPGGPARSITPSSLFSA
jgi:hypothetical protein